MNHQRALVWVCFAVSGCVTQGHLAPDSNRPPAIELLSPMPDYGRVAADADLVVEAVATDLDDYAEDLITALFIEEVLVDTAVPDADGWVELDWRTPSTPGDVHVRLVVTDPSPSSAEHHETYRVQ